MWVLQLLTLLLKPTGRLLEDRNGCKAWHPVAFSFICWMNENLESQTIEEGSFFSLLSFVEFKRWSSTEKEWSRSGWSCQNLTLISSSGKLHLVHLKCSMNCGNAPVLETSIVVPSYPEVPIPCSSVSILTSGPTGWSMWGASRETQYWYKGPLLYYLWINYFVPWTSCMAFCPSTKDAANTTV